MSTQLELFKAHREAQGKYTYFVLAAAGAGIAFALNQTKGQALEASHALVGAAVLSWALSFWSGCHYLRLTQSFLNMNGEVLRIEEGRHAQYPRHPDVVSAAHGALDKLNTKLGRWSYFQLVTLYCGALFYIAWHALDMYLRS
jgi:hypothetical protein